jgi:hypothetical protein
MSNAAICFLHHDEEASLIHTNPMELVGIWTKFNGEPEIILAILDSAAKLFNKKCPFKGYEGNQQWFLNYFIEAYKAYDNAEPLLIANLDLIEYDDYGAGLYVCKDFKVVKRFCVHGSLSKAMCYDELNEIEREKYKQVFNLISFYYGLDENNV